MTAESPLLHLYFMSSVFLSCHISTYFDKIEHLNVELEKYLKYWVHFS